MLETVVPASIQDVHFQNFTFWFQLVEKNSLLVTKKMCIENVIDGFRQQSAPLTKEN